MLNNIKEQPHFNMDYKEQRNHLYADYIKEREGADIIETPLGLAVYKWGSDNVYLQDIYVVPEARQSGLGVQLMRQVESLARERGIFKMYGSVAPSTDFGHQMLCIMIKLGFKLASSQTDIIYLVKDIDKEPL